MSIHSARTRPASQDRGKSIDGKILAARQPVRDTLSIGIDFGTTNTVVAIARPGETVRAAQFYDDRELSDIYRSVPCFEHLDHYDTASHAGMKAIRAFLESVYETRFIQSFKSHVASRAFEETRIGTLRPIVLALMV